MNPDYPYWLYSAGFILMVEYVSTIYPGNCGYLPYPVDKTCGKLFTQVNDRRGMAVFCLILKVSLRNLTLGTLSVIAGEKLWKNVDNSPDLADFQP